MKKLVSVLAAGAAVLAGTSLLGISAASAKSSPARQIVPHAVTCLAADTGTKGGTGIQGPTGPTGPVGDTGRAPSGVVRAAHARTLNCASLPGVCAAPGLGVQGAAGLAGATGPKGDTGTYFIGVVRKVHPRQVGPCDGFPSECVYSVSPTGDTGPIGDTGAKGSSGAALVAPGAPRAPHRFVGGLTYQPGASVSLSQCNLPSTGGRSMQLMPWALALVAGGLAVLFVTRRRSATL